jgi:hypothetical protein
LDCTEYLIGTFLEGFPSSAALSNFLDHEGIGTDSQEFAAWIFAAETPQERISVLCQEVFPRVVSLAALVGEPVAGSAAKYRLANR